MPSTTSLALFLCAVTAPLVMPYQATAQSLAAAARAAADQSAATQPFRITSTRTDPSTGQLVIVGTGFRPDVVVKLNSARLGVVSVLSHEVRAEMPALLPGSYRLLVDQRRHAAQQFVVTIGVGGSDDGGGVPGPPGPAGPQGPMGPQGPAGPAGASGGLTVLAANGATFGTLINFALGQPSVVALQDNGVWLGAQVDSSGVAPVSYYALYADDLCGTAPFVPLSSNPAPLLRLLQTTNPGDTTGYYAGNPLQVRAFASLSPLGHPEQCQSAVNTGWDQPMLAGPARTFDLSPFPAPFVIK